MYRLYIQPPNSTATTDWFELDLGDEQPAMNCQINNLAELKDRNGSYSQRIKLPRSNRNCAGLGFITEFEAVAPEAYRPCNAFLTCDDIRISPIGALLGVEEITPDGIEVQIYSATYDFFKMLGALKMDNSTATGFTARWSASDVPDNGIGALSNSIEYRYLFATVDKNIGNLLSSKTWINTIRALYPHLPLINTLREILWQKGYRLITDITQTSDNKDYIPCLSPEMLNGQYSYVIGNVGRTMVRTGSVGWIIQYGPDVPDSTGRADWLVSGSQPVVWALQDCTVRVIETIQADKPIGAGGANWVSINRNIRVIDSKGATVSTVINSDYPITAANKTYSVTHIVELKFGQGVTIQTNCTNNQPGASTTTVDSYFSVRLNADANAAEDDATALNRDTQIGSTLDLLASTGFATVLDLFKAFTQLYGLTVDVNATTKYVYAYTTNHIYAQRDAGNYVDWSAAFAVGNSERMTFTIGDYAQTNRILMKENPNDSNYTDIAAFNVNNKTLPQEKDLFTLGFESGRNTGNGSGVLANYPLFVVADNGIDRTYEGKAGTHVVQINFDSQKTLEVKQGTFVKKISLHHAIHRRVDFYLFTYYDALINRILVNARALTVPLELSPSDIQQLDFFKPVFIDYYGAYFYILKINNFVAGKLTLCDVVKL